MKTVDLLNKLRWDGSYDFAKVRVWYICRGSLQDKDIVWGSEIKSIGKKFLETTRGYIPYHRIIKIKYDEDIIYEQ